MPDGPSWSFPGRKSQQIWTDSPGPGEYNIRGPIGTGVKTIAFGSPSKRSGNRNETPGPGQYISSNGERGPAYSFGGRHKQQPKDGAPGPGAYFKERRSSGPAWSLPGRARDSAAYDAPGPGAYRVEDTLKHSKKGGYMGAKSRARNSETTPAPGDYTSDHHYKGYGKGPAYSLAGRARETAGVDIPGPGAYHRKGGLVKENAGTRTYHMNGREQRFKYAVDGTPGPGQYNRHSTVGQAPAYSLSGRIEFKQRADTPGPGAYLRPGSAPAARSSSLGKAERFNNSNGDLSPGPGAYLLPKALDDRGPSIGARTPLGFGRNESPGPGAYERPASAPSRRSIAFGKDNRFHRKFEEIPGPGQYNTQGSLISPLKAASLAGKPREKKPEDSPGHLLPRRTASGDHAFVGRNEWGHGMAR